MTKKILAVFLAFLYSIVCIILGPMIKSQSFTIGGSWILPFILVFLICSAVNILVFCVIPKKHIGIRCERISGYFDRIGDRKLFFAVWALIFVSWIPALLILYPGVLSYDMISQVGSALGKIVNNHHPVLHTWLIRVFMRLGDRLFAGYEYGLGILSVVQMILLSYALTRLVMLLKKKRVPIPIVILTAFFSAFWYMNACLSVTMVKDTLHAAFLVLFVCHFAEIVTEPAEYIKRKVNLIVLPIVSFLMCAFRNNGIHIYLFCFAFLAVLRIGKIRKIKTYIVLAVSILSTVFMYKIYTGPVFDALAIRPGEVREALCIPIQQLQRVAVSREDDLTAEQTELMSYYIDNLEWMEASPGQMYDPFFADPAKSCFYSEHYSNDPVAFWKFYLQIGKQFPKEYAAAFLSNTVGYWYPGFYGYSYVMYDNYPPEMFEEPLERKAIAELPVVQKYYESVCTSEFWRETPVLRLFFVPGFSVWIFIYALILAWKDRGFVTGTLPLFLPPAAQYGIMILSPMSSFRYSWPFYLMLPIVFIGVFRNRETYTLNESSSFANRRD